MSVLENLMDDQTTYWFVGANWGGKDQTPAFLSGEYWENGYDDKYTDLVNSMRPGDKIVIKSAFTQKRNLPFNSNGNTASVMSIKAVGIVKKGATDGKRVMVQWDQSFKEKKWFFYTHRGTVWKINQDYWCSKELIDFVFNDKEQEYNKFRNDPFWRERFGDIKKDGARFQWTKFYEELASKLLSYKDDRKSLLFKLHEFSKDIATLNHLNDKDSNGNKFPLEDICPFTVLGCFNRGITTSNRIQIAEKFASVLGVEADLPKSFEGIPVLNNQKSWFFAYKFDRKDTDINSLWELFDFAIQYADGDDGTLYEKFKESYDKAAEVKNVGWNISMGLYWIRPWSFIPLDGNTQKYLIEKLNVSIDKNGAKDKCNADDYLRVSNLMESRFGEPGFPVHSFPELSLEAWRYQPSVSGGDTTNTWKQKIYSLVKEFCIENKSDEIIRKDFHDRYVPYLEKDSPNNNTISKTIDRTMQELRDDDILEFVKSGVYKWLEYDEGTEVNNGYSILLNEEKTYEKYSLNSILEDGCFLEKEDLENILNTLKRKKNIVLQGPPGTGKTWLGKRIAFALIGEINEQKVKAVQFHSNLSYEDFIRGWRPSATGSLELQDGPFLDMVYLAQKNPNSKFVVVIEEINRGKPSQIFGEVLTLIEADKRTPREALELTYGKEGNKKVFIPNNLFVIGTMNIADRSLALVDLALRRRFSFIDLKPQFGTSWEKWLMIHFKFSSTDIDDIRHRIKKLNRKISDEQLLGEQFQIGHSYVTPIIGTEVNNCKSWFAEVIETEIFPLLQEYYFDNPSRSKELRDELLKDW
jgi:5-methylcytosine-specific restriction enzyme B